MDGVDPLYRRLFEQCADALLVVDSETLRVGHFNPQALLALAIPAGELAERMLNELEVSLSRRELSRRIWRMVHDGRAEWRASFHRGDGQTVEFDVECQTTTFWNRPAWVLRLRSGNLPPAPLLAEPPTTDKRAEAGLYAAERWDLMATELPGLIYQTCGPTDCFELRVPYINDRVEEYTGWTAQEIYAAPMRLFQAIHPEDWPRYCDTAIAAMTRLEQFQIELRLVSTKTGNIRWLRFVSRPQVLENGDQLWSGIGLDISESKEHERHLHRFNEELERRIGQRNAELRLAQEQAVRLHALLAQSSRADLVRAVAADVAHKVHQPLAVIANYSGGAIRRLEQGQLDSSELKDLLGEIVEEVMRAGQVVREIRDFVESRGVQRERCDLNELVFEAVRLAEMLHRSRLMIRVAASDEPLIVYVDRTQVMQVMLDLLSNAADAIEEAGVAEPAVEIGIAREAQLAVVTVQDNGAGVPLEKRPQIFDQFYTTKSHGMGVGLPIGRIVIENHGGTLELRSVSSGTQFRFTLPLDRREATTSRQYDEARSADDS